MKTLKTIFRTLFIVALLAGLFLPAGMVRAQANPARFGVFEPFSVASGAVVEIPIRVENVTDLYALDFELRFDPVLFAAQDADPNMAGIQMGFGGFLDAGLLLFNTVDNQTGIARFVMTQVAPSEPKSGSGILLVLYLKGLQVGTSDLIITNLQAADRAGNEIPSSKVENTVTVSNTAPQVTATSIPVVNPTAMLVIPTQQPTATATIAPLPTATQLAASAVPANPEPTQKVIEPTAGSATEPAVMQGSFLVQNWWIVALVLALAAGLGAYFLRTRPKD